MMPRLNDIISSQRELPKTEFKLEYQSSVPEIVRKSIIRPEFNNTYYLNKMRKSKSKNLIKPS